MRLLADTHAIIWWLAAAPSLSRRARQAFEDPTNELLVSAASIYEITFKQRRGRLDGTADELLAALRAARVTLLPVEASHAAAAGGLPGPHRDPWDRILIAQAAVERLTMVTVDPVFADYGVPVIW